MSDFNSVVAVIFVLVTVVTFVSVIIAIFWQNQRNRRLVDYNYKNWPARRPINIDKGGWNPPPTAEELLNRPPPPAPIRPAAEPRPADYAALNSRKAALAEQKAELARRRAALIRHENEMNRETELEVGRQAALLAAQSAAESTTNFVVTDTEIFAANQQVDYSITPGGGSFGGGGASGDWTDSTPSIQPDPTPMYDPPSAPDPAPTYDPPSYDPPSYDSSSSSYDSSSSSSDSSSSSSDSSSWDNN